MLNNVNYNIVNLDISNGLNGHRIAGGQDYISLLDSPLSAEIFITLGDKNNPKIPLKNEFAIKYNNGLDIFVFSTAVENGKIKLATSNRAGGGIEIITNPQIDSINTIDKINNINKISGLDNITMPIKTNFLTLYKNVFGNANGQKTGILCDIVLDTDCFILCDISLHPLPVSNTEGYISIFLKIDDTIVSAVNSYEFTYSGVGTTYGSANSGDFPKLNLKGGQKIELSYASSVNIPNATLTGFISAFKYEY